MRDLPIGALSERTGVKVPTIRYYEQAGLMPPAARTEANRRTYSVQDVDRLRFIRHARELGFEVDAIRQLLGLADQPDRSCADAARRDRPRAPPGDREQARAPDGPQGRGATHDRRVRARAGR